VYAIEVIPEVSDQIETLHPKRFRQIAIRIFALQMNPRPPDCVLVDIETYRIQTGPYMITYAIDDSQQRVRVFLLEEQSQEKE
jgi:mRNA-degrading endonuclease RelE of RelBE toxin-antitoxin system